MTDDTPWTTTELLRRMDEGRSWVESGLTGLDEAAWDQPVGGGWTRRQMAQHLVVWHELTIERLAAYRRTGQRPELARHEDEVNADAAAQGARRSGDELLADFSDSYERLRAQVALLRDEQLTELDGWPGGVVVGNTYGHYEDHRADIERRPAE